MLRGLPRWYVAKKIVHGASVELGETGVVHDMTAMARNKAIQNRTQVLGFGIACERARVCVCVCVRVCVKSLSSPTAPSFRPNAGDGVSTAR